MNDKELKSRNRRVGLSIIGGMLLLAALTAAYAWFTIGYRRDVDAMKPDARPMKDDLINVVALTAVAVGGGYLIYRWRAGKAK